MERNLSRAERLNQLEVILLTYPDGLAVTQISNMLNVHRATVYRDIDTLSKSVPIIEEDGRYYIDRTHYLTNVRLTPGESLMLYLTMRIMIRRLTHVPSSMFSAMEKLTLALHHPVTTQLAESISRLRKDQDMAQSKPHVWDLLQQAWFEQITVRIAYKKFQAEHTTNYELQPYLFEPALLSEGIYVIGYSLTHDEIRTFKVERIMRVSLTTQSFERPARLTADDLLQHAWGIWYGEDLHEVRLLFRNPVVARRVHETRWHPSQMIEDLPDGGLIWSVQIAGVKELIPWIRSWGSACEVLSPPSLRAQIAGDMREAAELYA